MLKKKNFEYRDGKIVAVPDEIIEEKELEHLVKKNVEQYHTYICEICGKKFLSTYNQSKCNECGVSIV